MNATRRAVSGLAAGLLASALSVPCSAIDYQPFDWVPLPPRTSVAMLYYQFATRSELDNTISGRVGTDTRLDSHIGIARYLYYQQALGVPFVIDVLLPFGTLRNGKVGGVDLGHASGLGDPTLSLGLWVVNQPHAKRYASGVSFLTLPLGSYDEGRPLNVGSHRVQHDLQADFTQGILGKLTLDLSADWIWYGPNSHAGSGRQRLTQDSSFGTYAWLSYETTSLWLGPLPSAISVGYLATYGGKQSLDGIETGAESGEQQLRVSYGQFVTPSLQALLSVSRDVSVRGQFKQDLGVLARLAALF
jgi:Putative MetA-pathway of phenol degradation